MIIEKIGKESTELRNVQPVLRLIIITNLEEVILSLVCAYKLTRNIDFIAGEATHLIFGSKELVIDSYGLNFNLYDNAKVLFEIMIVNHQKPIYIEGN